jgi:hypothetical protein
MRHRMRPSPCFPSTLSHPNSTCSRHPSDWIRVVRCSGSAVRRGPSRTPPPVRSPPAPGGRLPPRSSTSLTNAWLSEWTLRWGIARYPHRWSGSRPSPSQVTDGNTIDP